MLWRQAVELLPGYLLVWQKIASYHPLSKQGCAVLWFPPLHDWFSYTFPPWKPVHMVVSPLRNMAYFLLQMSSLGIYLLNCKGRKIIHISVIRHARNTSQNPIRLVIKKEKATVWYYGDLKSLPKGFYSLIILVFSLFFFPLFCLWIEQQCELVDMHNVEQIKNKDDRGKRWIYSPSRPCFFEEIHGSRTHFYSSSTQQRENGNLHVNGPLW